MANRLAPPADLLQQVEGVEQGLLKGRRLGAVGGIGSIVAGAAEIALIVAQNVANIDFAKAFAAWPYLVPGFLLALSLGLRNWSRLWLRESKEPFRFTFSVDTFAPVPESAIVEPKLSWLQSDLRDLLAARIKRLQRLDEGAGSTEGEGAPSVGTSKGEDATVPNRSHIHVSGAYIVREPPGGDDRARIEVSTWVRMGPAGKPSRLAHPVRYTSEPRPNSEPDGQSERPKQPEGTAQTASSLSSDDYRRVLERVYFSVATEIYMQIRNDVQHKIDLLPNDRFRAVAYFHEAEDFAHSNTLDAYEAARQLYAEAIRRYNPGWARLASGRVRRGLQDVRRTNAALLGWTRLLLAKMWPRLARKPLLLSRAEIGYANMLLYRRALAALSGQRVNSVFEARPVVSTAVERLRNMHENVPRQPETLFEAFVALGLTWTFLRSRRRADAFLTEARDLRPLDADQDARFLFAAGMSETRILSKLPLLRRAVELNPDFEVARFHLALTSEKLWRTRPTLEAAVARDFVCEYYREVVAINPGNVAAWSHLGYVLWLIGNREGARSAYESGLQYKDIKDDTYVAELEYGLARIAAEEAAATDDPGGLEEAFRHYRLGVIEEVGQGNAYRPRGYTGYFFEGISFAMLRRFWRYRKRALSAVHGKAGAGLPGRVKAAVESFVRNEFAEGCWNFYLRSSDRRFLDRARGEYDAARSLDPEYVVPPYRLYWVLREVEEIELRKDESGVLKAVGELNDAAFECLEAVNRLEPKWLDGNIALALEHARRGRATPDRDIFGTLLPHGWLWTYDGSQEQQLDWTALRAEFLKRDLTWEREFDDVHVVSLFTLAQVLAITPPLPQPKLLTGIRKRQQLRREPTADRASELLAHIQRHYYPDDVELLRMLAASAERGLTVARAAPGNRNSLRNMAKLWLSDDSVTYRALKGRGQIICRESRSAAEVLGALDKLITELWTFPNRAKRIAKTLSWADRWRVRSQKSPDRLKGRIQKVCTKEAERLAVRGWLANEPQPFWALRALCDGEPGLGGTSDGGLFSVEERVAWLLAVSKQRYRSPVLLIWVGDQLRQLGSTDQATRSYRAAEAATVDAQLSAVLRERLGPQAAPGT